MERHTTPVPRIVYRATIRVVRATILAALEPIAVYPGTRESAYHAHTALSLLLCYGITAIRDYRATIHLSVWCVVYSWRACRIHHRATYLKYVHSTV